MRSTRGGGGRMLGAGGGVVPGRILMRGAVEGCSCAVS